MKVLFAGTPAFAVPSLLSTALSADVVGVLTAPDTARGRGRSIEFSDVKKAALEKGLPIFQPGKINREFRETVKSLSPDLLVCVAFGKIFRQEFLDCFPKGGINVHPSLLPRHRGPSPVTAAILAGDKVTGVTVQRLARAMDSGDILAQMDYRLKGDETGDNLLEILAGEGARLLPGVLNLIEDGKESARPQDEGRATYCGLVKKEDGFLSWNESAAAIERMIRAYHPWPGVSALFNGKRLFFRKAGVFSGNVPEAGSASGTSSVPGTVSGVDKDHGILIHTIEGILAVSVLQLEFKKALDWRSFVNGNSSILGYAFGGPDAGFGSH